MEKGLGDDKEYLVSLVGGNKSLPRTRSIKTNRNLHIVEVMLMALNR